MQFYRLLFDSSEFCSELGKVTLASSQLEAELIRLLTRKRVPQNVDGLTLGRLIRVAKKHGVLEPNVLSALNEITGQRNYLTHNIYALFIELIEETRLERTNLLDSDVQTYIERAWELRENLLGLLAIVQDS